MHVVLVSWSIKPDMEEAFLEEWGSRPVDNASGLVAEFLSKVQPKEPEFDWELTTRSAIAYVNVAIWRDKQDFLRGIDRTRRDEGFPYEAAKRKRACLQIKEGRLGDLPLDDLMQQLG